MFESSVEERYKNNATFRNLVDILRSELRRYDTTPRELREATMLASTMHEAEHIRPMFIYKDEFPIDYWKAYSKCYPAMFGGAPQRGLLCNHATADIDSTCRRTPTIYMHPITKMYQHDFSIVRYSDNQKPSVYYVCSKCGLSDTYISTLEYKACEKF